MLFSNINNRGSRNIGACLVIPKEIHTQFHSQSKNIMGIYAFVKTGWGTPMLVEVIPPNNYMEYSKYQVKIPGLVEQPNSRHTESRMWGQASVIKRMVRNFKQKVEDNKWEICELRIHGKLHPCPTCIPLYKNSGMNFYLQFDLDKLVSSNNIWVVTHTDEHSSTQSILKGHECWAYRINALDHHIGRQVGYPDPIDGWIPGYIAENFEQAMQNPPAGSVPIWGMNDQMLGLLR